MKTSRTLMLVALLPPLLMSQPASAAEAPYRQRIEKFFALLMEGKNREAVEFIFEYYRPEDEWRVFSFSLDDKLDDDIEDAARKALLPP